MRVANRVSRPSARSRGGDPLARRLASAFGLVLFIGLCAACVNPPSSPPPPDRRVDAGEGNQPWYSGTPQMQAGIRELMAKIPGTSGAERIDLGRRIVSYGEPAVPALVEALADSNADTRGTAAWLLGFLGDPRTGTPLVRAMDDPAPLVRYEAAGSLLRLHDERGLPTLVDGLEDADPRVRGKCLMLLEDHTGETFGYRPDLAPDGRAAAIARWRQAVRTRGLEIR